MKAGSSTSTNAYIFSARMRRQASTIAPGSASNSASVGETTSISQIAKSLMAASEVNSSQNSGKTYDFTNMSPSQFGKLIGDGKITGGHMILSPAQLQLMTKETSGVKASKSDIDAANNTPVNYVQLYANAINKNLASGLPIVGLQNILDQMKALQGSASGTSSSTPSDAASSPQTVG